jgi:hypothetical protein
VDNFFKKQSNIKQAAIPLANPAAICRALPGGEAVLVNMDTAGSLALNHTGFAVWQLVDGRRTVAEIIAAVSRQFSDAPANVAEDVVALLEELAADGFIGFEWRADVADACFSA